jgi:hypothetical protein
VIAGVVSVLAGCGTGPGERNIAAYQVYFLALGGDTTAQRTRAYDCVVTGHFTVPTPLEPSGTIQVPIQITRSLSEQSGDHREFTSADTVINEAVLAYDGLGEQSLSFSLTAGSYSVAPPAGNLVSSTAEYSADWTCGPDFPLGQDSLLLFYGYDPNLEIAGRWHIFENLPIE